MFSFIVKFHKVNVESKLKLFYVNNVYYPWVVKMSWWLDMVELLDRFINHTILCQEP